ncbi:NUDIX domain-containing protein [Streptomyces sp. NPDC049915]|uniref:NUDIX domain-containing protein n=1 Tax=Streptomyces sp. NPDC049915 TaxID=3155510 RepID=UPI00342A1F67
MQFYRAVSSVLSTYTEPGIRDKTPQSTLRRPPRGRARTWRRPRSPGRRRRPHQPKTLPGHVTASAILAGLDGRILHILHNPSQKWLLPGGVEASDNTLLQAAWRELAEETGIRPTSSPCRARPRSTSTLPLSTPAHQGRARSPALRLPVPLLQLAEIGELQTEEVSDAAWRHIESMLDDLLRQRITQALR